MPRGKLVTNDRVPVDPELDVRPPAAYFSAIPNHRDLIHHCLLLTLPLLRFAVACTIQEILKSTNAGNHNGIATLGGFIPPNVKINNREFSQIKNVTGYSLPHTEK